MILAKLINNDYPLGPSIFERIFDGELMDWNRTDNSGISNTLPAVNVKERDNEYSIEVAAPGLKKEDFQVNYDNGLLTVSSEKKDGFKKKEGEKITRHEFNYHSFKRSFTVDEDFIDNERIVANYKDGILSVLLPKRKEVKQKNAKYIEIM